MKLISINQLSFLGGGVGWGSKFWDFQQFVFTTFFSKPPFLNMIIPQQGLALGVLTCLEELVPAVRSPGSPARVLSAGAQRRSAPKVPRGFLRICLMAGSAGFRGNCSPGGFS